MASKDFSSTLDPNAWTASALRAEDALNVPIGLMDAFASDRRGRPRKEQRSLYLAAVTFTYAVWESYIEDVAIEITEVLAPAISSRKVPPPVRDALSDRGAWQLAVDPGWRDLWVAEVSARAKGGPGVGHGINTASFGNVKGLLAVAGIADALPGRLSVGPETRLGSFKSTPPKVTVQQSDLTVDVKRCLGRLITLRGEAVHTAGTEDTLLKEEVLWWTAFIRDLHERVDTLATKKAHEQLTE